MNRKLPVDAKSATRQLNFVDGPRTRLAAILVPAAIALGLCIYQLTLPHTLSGLQRYENLSPDDGVALGASLGLITGHVPYKDFVFLHPPGIALLMAPIALLGKLTGTQTALAVARILTALITSANAGLAASCIRHRGSGAMITAGFLLACWPLAVTADRTLMLEPYLVLICLLGVLTMFSGGTVASARRLLLAGVGFGLAATIALGGLIVAVVALATCLRRRDAAAAIGRGFAIGFGVLCLPFFVLAPASFISQVFANQIGMPGRAAGDYRTATSRLLDLTGVSGLTVVHPSPMLAFAVLIVVFGGLAAIFGLRYRTLTRFDAMVGGSCLAIAIALFAASAMRDHSTYFLASFLAVTVASALVPACDSGQTGHHRAPAPSLVPPLVAGFLASFLVPQQLSYAKTYLAGATDPAGVVQAAIPPGACVVTDQVIITIVADRFNTSGFCPQVVDSYGTWIDLSPSTPPPPMREGVPQMYSAGALPSQLKAIWSDWFLQADYVIQAWPPSTVIPWTPELQDWFAQHYKVVHQQPGVSVFQKIESPHTGSAPLTPG
jgi:hypothetical protein